MLTVGLLRAIRRRGFAVRGAKSGPDYIDPAFHRAATGEASLNFDSWAMPPVLLDETVREAGVGVDYRHADTADFDSELDMERRINEAGAGR